MFMMDASLSILQLKNCKLIFIHILFTKNIYKKLFSPVFAYAALIKLIRNMRKQLVIATTIFIVVFNSCKKEDLTPVAVSTSSVDNMYTETSLPVQKAITYNVDANIGGYLEALPAHYADHTGMHYSLIIFLHGQGEIGDGSQSSLPIVADNSIPHLIATQQFPANFSVGGGTYQFIVLSPQFKSWPQTADINDMFNYAIKKYRIDTTRLYLCGLSMGGGGVEDYAWSSGKRISALVSFSGASYPTTYKGQCIAQDTIGFWAFHNNDDGTVPPFYSIDYVQYINNYNPHRKAKLTLWPSGGHDSWTKGSDPNYRENGKNIYEYMLSYRKK